MLDEVFDIIIDAFDRDGRLSIALVFYNGSKYFRVYRVRWFVRFLCLFGVSVRWFKPLSFFNCFIGVFSSSIGSHDECNIVCTKYDGGTSNISMATRFIAIDECFDVDVILRFYKG